LLKNRVQIAKGIAQFLNELHGIKTRELKKLKLGNRVVLKEYKRFHKDVKKYLYPKLDQDKKAMVQEFFDRLKIVLKQKTPKVLVHGDLSFDHILLMPNLKSVAGIIDFSDRSLSDTARDFTFFWNDKKFIHEVYKHYKFKDDTLLERSKIYFQGSALWEAVSAIKHKAFFEKFIAMYKNMLISTR
jgi:aminoglycoside phosphotransferase (APT) family kinase protein